MTAEQIARYAKILSCMLSAENSVADSMSRGDEFQEFYGVLAGAADGFCKYLKRIASEDEYSKITRICAEMLLSHANVQTHLQDSLEQ